MKDTSGTDHQGSRAADWEEESLLGILEDLRPRLERLFRTLRIPPEDAEAMLDESVMLLLYRQSPLYHPERWLTRTLRRRCVRYWRTRQREEWLKMELQLQDWLEEEGISQLERRQRRQLLTSLVERLPRRCQSLISHRFHPPLRARYGQEAPLPTSLAREQESRCMAAMLNLLKGVGEDDEGSGR